MEACLEAALGINSDSLTWWQMAIRAVVVFCVALLILRIGSNRIFGKQTAFDIVLGIIYGSVLSRAITGNSPFFPTLVAALVLMLLHKGLAVAAYHSNFGFGNFIKGKPVVLIKNGEILRDALEKSTVTEDDLKEALRSKGTVDDLGKVKAAYLERSGKISVILKDN
ncbi:DUF421 domain-containing protein [Pontibacter sp. 13R65]|uniref:DUF421 domain-containing protein n=1 Tax=Pontibacter sp. 13R65 TaxID=3127458 RepID=UPI00301CDAF7